MDKDRDRRCRQSEQQERIQKSHVLRCGEVIMIALKKTGKRQEKSMACRPAGLLFPIKTPTFSGEDYFQWYVRLHHFPHKYCHTYLLSFLSLLLFSVSFCEEPLIVRPEFETGRTIWPGLEHKVLKRPRIALVLSGGGARGIAQIGVLKALERYGVPIDFITATSLGAVVGGLYASGYTPAELESLATSTDWDDVLSLTRDTERADLFVEQKMEEDRTFISLRFEGFEPVLPEAVSSGQRLTNFLNGLTLRAVYQPDHSFDDLRIPFRAVSTDLVSGKRIILSDGSLAEALRASATVPLLFTPVVKDSLRLVDGGLVSNVPVDVARAEGYDLVIAVNTTSGMRAEEDLAAPWQTADQIMGIMMQFSNRDQLRKADVVIVPDLENHLSSDFNGIEGLIRRGECAAEAILGEFLPGYEDVLHGSSTEGNQAFPSVVVERDGEWGGDSLWVRIWEDLRDSTRSLADVGRNVARMFMTGELSDAYARVYAGGEPVRVVYVSERNLTIRGIRLEGPVLVPPGVLEKRCSSLVGRPLTVRTVSAVLESLLRFYRQRGYSLARIDEVSADTSTGFLTIRLSEGVIRNIRIEGAENAQEEFILRQFPLKRGDVFEIDRATQGLENINGTTLFEYVQLEVAYPTDEPQVTIRVKERPTQLLSLGLRSDNERNLQGLIDLRDNNLGGTGASLGLSLAGGGRNQEFSTDYHRYRLFNTYLSMEFGLFYRAFDYYLYGDGIVTEPGRWKREQIGEYRTRRYGGHIALGAELEKIGNSYLDFSKQNVRTTNRRNAQIVEEEYDLTRLRIGTLVDSKDSYAFPTRGVGMDFSFEFGVEALGGDVVYNAFRARYETYLTWGSVHTIHPVITLGFADKTMPFAEQFRLGGRETMFGLREDDRRGRQLLLMNLEYRWRFPFQILFDTYLHIRYDLGNISEVPEQIKFSSFRHGVGAEISLDTPVGPAAVGVGKNFYFLKISEDNPVQQGPFLFYFMIGYPLWLPSSAMPS
jgi:NTE family protein